MADPRHDAALEARLRALAGRLTFPSGPDLAPSVTAALAARRRPAPRWHSLARAAVVATVLLLATAAAVLAASPGAREAVADRLGIGGVRIEFVPATPTVPAPTPTSPPTSATSTPTVSASPTPLAAPLLLGEVIDGETTVMPFTVRRPAIAGPPAATYLDRTAVPGGSLTMVWPASPALPETTIAGVGLLLQQFRGVANEGPYGKGLGPGTALESATVNGYPGYWITGEPHAFYYYDATGEPVEDRLRLAGNTLVWVEGDVTYRLESALPLLSALRLAESLTP